MKYDFYSFLKSERLDRISYNRFKNNQNLYFLHSKRDKLWDNKPGGDYSLYFRSKSLAYNFCPYEIWEKLNNLESDDKLVKTLPFTLTSPLYTASENKFYSIENQFAKEKATGLPVFKGSSLKGALRQAAVDNLEDELMERNNGEKSSEYNEVNEDTNLKTEENKKDDRFFFKERAKLVRLFGTKKDLNWFTFKSLLATGGIRISDVNKPNNVLKKISNAFDNYLKKNKIVNSEGVCRGRLIFSDLYFKKVVLDVITPLKRDKRTPASGPIYYEVVPAGENTSGAIIWFPFDLITKGESEERINKELEEDRKLIKRAFEKLQQMGIGAKTKAGWGRFEIKWEDE